MTWKDRILDAALTSPSGTRLAFSYEDVSKSHTKRGASYEFPGVDGTLVIPSGRSSDTYPLECFFSGDDCDTLADDFEKILNESGVFTLEHPKYGRRNVVPLGSIERSDKLKSAYNQVSISVEFFETLLNIYPQEGEDLASAATLSIEAATDAFAGSFPTPPSRSGFRAQMVETTDYIRDLATGAERDFKEIERAINSTLDTFISDPINLGYQVLRLIQTPGQIAGRIGARLEASANLLNNLINRGYTSDADLQVAGALQLATLSSINSTLSLKTEATSAAGVILDMFDAWVTWREDAGADDTDGVYAAMLDAVSKTAGYLIQISFNLLPERAITTTRPYDILTLCFELYGSVDGLDFFITSNDLAGSEILEIPEGRRIVYYI